MANSPPHATRHSGARANLSGSADYAFDTNAAAYDNPKLLAFLGSDDGDAEAATAWIRDTHVALARAIEAALQGHIDARIGQA